MLKELYIKNLAIIDELILEFESGLNIITGQTGSGKSIVINAIDLLLGAKFNKNLIRTGKDSCVVEGYFLSDSGNYRIRRVFNMIGSSKSFLNEMPSTLQEIKSISINLVDFHGQHNHQKLLNIDSHIDYLDAFGSYHKDLEKIKLLFVNTNKAENDLKRIISKQKDAIEKEELYNFQLEELLAFDLIPGIDDKIESKYKTLINSKEIKENLENAINNLDVSQDSVLSIMNQNKRQLDKFQGINLKINLFLDRLEQTIVDIKDLSDEMNDYNSSMNIDQNQLDDISEKFAFIEMIKRKYGGSIESAIEYKNKIQMFLDNMTSFSKQIKSLNKKLITYREEYNRIAKKLSLKRKENASLINKKIIPVLKDIGMDETIIDFQVTKNQELFNINGIDSCIIKISTNIGEKLKPLNEIVSGGELSRIMLAIKMLLQDKDPVDTIVFDEVDSGISGRIAEKVGSQIESLGMKRQIVCITHLSQIACKGNYHLAISKKNDDKKTNVCIEKLTKNKRISEIASLISGMEITENAMNQAKELLFN